MESSNIIYEDTTLRDGEQTPGLFFTKGEKLTILERLLEAGVTHIEAGIPAMGGEELEFLKDVPSAGYGATILAWNRGIKADVKQSLDLGFTAVHIGLPTSNLHLEHSIGKTRMWILQNAVELIKFAKDKGSYVSISAEDVGRTERDFLLEYAHTVKEAGADRLRLSDTVGILTPERYGAIVSLVVNNVGIPVQCHTHNDYGLALANLLAGLKAGATYFHATINGIGERAGMTDLFQAYLVLKNLYNVNLNLDAKKLYQLSVLMEEYTKVKLPPWYPIVGDNVFAHESGIHVNGMLKNSKTFEPFDPEEVGGTRKYVLGKHSGRALISLMLTNKGLDFDELILTKCLGEVREISISQKRPVTENQLLEIYENLRRNGTV